MKELEQLITDNGVGESDADELRRFAAFLEFRDMNGGKLAGPLSPELRQYIGLDKQPSHVRT